MARQPRDAFDKRVRLHRPARPGRLNCDPRCCTFPLRMRMYLAVCAAALVGLAACGDNDTRYAVSLSASQVEIDVGQHATVSATLDGGGDPSQLQWKIADTSIATVTGAGGEVTVDAVAEGSTTLTVTFE